MYKALARREKVRLNSNQDSSTLYNYRIMSGRRALQGARECTFAHGSIMLKPMTRTPPATEIVFKVRSNTRSATYLPSGFEESTKAVAVDDEVADSECAKASERQCGALAIRSGLQFVSSNTLSFCRSTSFLFLILVPDANAENGESIQAMDSRAGLEIVASHAAMSKSAAATRKTSVPLAIFNDSLQRWRMDATFELSKVKRNIVKRVVNIEEPHHCAVTRCRNLEM